MSISRGASPKAQQLGTGEAQHQRIRQHLLVIVEAHRLAGRTDRLFTEQEIAAQFGVHRLTARHAIQSLVTDGLVYGLRGRGTFLAPVKIIEPIDRLTSFLEEWPSQRHGVRAQVLRCAIQPNPGTVRGLSRALWPKLLHFVRVRFTDSAPIAVDYRWARPHLASHLTSVRLQATAIQQLLKEASDSQLIGTQIEIEAVAAQLAEAGLLKTVVGAPLLLSRVQEHAGQDVLVSGHSYHRSDLFKYQVSLPPS